MEEKIEDMAKGGTLTNENVGILLQTFVDSLIEDIQNKGNQKDKRRTQTDKRSPTIKERNSYMPSTRNYTKNAHESY